MDEMMGLYIDDTKEFLAILNESIIMLEKHPDDAAAISEIFRAYHTMKSSTAAMEFRKTADFIHRMEDLLHEIREGRIRTDRRIIEILYVSFDYLEKFLHNVQDTGDEGGLSYESLLDKVKEILSGNGEKGAESARKDNSEESPFVLGEAVVLEAQKEASLGNQIYRITAVLSKDCAFRSVRVWMIFEEVSKVSNVIFSSPEMPEAEEFRNGSFHFEGTKVELLVSCGIPAAELYQELTRNMNEIESLLLDEIKPGFPKGTVLEDVPSSADTSGRSTKSVEENVSEVIDLIIGEDREPEPADALTEVKRMVKECELSMIELEVTQYNPDIVSEISCGLQAMYEVSSLTGNEKLSEIIRNVCGLFDLFTRRELEPDIVSIGLAADLLKFVKRMCDEVALREDTGFLEQINKKYGLLNDLRDLADKRKIRKSSTESKLGEILVKTGSMKDEDISEIIHLQKECYPNLKFGQIAVKENKADVKDVLGALHVQENVKSDLKNQTYIRIPAGKVDNLVDHLGELLITQSLHKQEIITTLNRDSGKALNNIIRMERIAKEIQDITMSLRMVSLKQTFQKIYRIGRDTALELEKDIDIETFGEETEIDRNIVDKLHDPLMHLIRNAISHGIEAVEERKAAGKPAAGRITLSASNRRGNVYIEISDDGKGLSVDKICKKAAERDLIDPSRKYTEDEILKFIYLPGFSTQEKVNSISGRGVGMNVVQTEVSKLGGKIEIENRQGKGCTFILKIPVNLATINGTIVELSGSNYIIPTLNIKQILKPQENQWVSVKGILSSMVIRNEIIPIIPIYHILRKEGVQENYSDHIIITVEHEQKLMALPVKTILGKQEVVVKQLGNDFSNLDFISGATILGDGRVSLILDVESLFKLTEEPAKPSR